MTALLTSHGFVLTHFDRVFLGIWIPIEGVCCWCWWITRKARK